MMNYEREIQDLVARHRAAAGAGATPPPFLDDPAEGSGVDHLRSRTPIATAGEGAIASARMLARVRAAGGPVDRRVASEQVHEVFRVLAEPYRGWSGFRTGNLVGLGSTIERGLGRAPGVLVRPTTAFFGPWWTGIRLLVTIAASAFLVAGEVRVALALVAFRVVGSTFQPTPGLSSDVLSSATHGTDKRARADWYVDWRACVVGHFCDALTLASIGLLLAGSGRSIWAAAVGLVAVTELSVTMLRVAAVQGGVVLRRLYLERVMRNGGLILGLTLAAVIQVDVPDSGPPLLALTALGGAVFAAGELYRVLFTSEAARKVDDMSTVDEMIWRRMANLLPVVERSAMAEKERRPGGQAVEVDAPLANTG